MSANPEWNVFLARSSDMKQIGQIPGAFQLTPTFNRPGAFSATFRLDHKIAYSVAKHQTCVICERNEAARWSGPITTVSRDPAEMTISITAIGWLDELSHRQVRPSEEASLTFSAVPGGEIVRTLINTVNAQTDTSGAVRPTHVSFGQRVDTQVRTRSYKRGQVYGQAIQELSDIENGLDLYVDPLTRKLSTYPPTFFQDRRKVVFGWGVEPFNLENAPQTDDGTDTAERITVVGSNGAIYSFDDPNAIGAHGGMMREKWITISDTSDATFLQAFANSELVYSRFGNVTYDLQPKQFGDTLRPWDDYNLGDQVYLSIGNAGALRVDNQAVRIFSVSINVDANGNEVISQITTSPSS